MASAPTKVSIILTTKNRVELLERSLNSACSQTFKNIEIIVVNDGSTDGTKNYLDDISDRDPRILVIHLKESVGACGARNLALNKATGHFFTNLDDDDYLENNRIASFVECFDANASLLYSGYRFIGKNLCYLSKKRPLQVAFEDIKKQNLIGNSIFTELSRVRALGGYDNSLVSWQDYDLWFRLIQHFGPAKYISNHSYVVDTQSAEHRITSSSYAHKGYLQFIDKHQKHFSEVELKYQKLNDLYNRNQKLSLAESYEFMSNVQLLKRLILLQLRSRVPKIYSYIANVQAKMHHQSK